MSETALQLTLRVANEAAARDGLLPKRRGGNNSAAHSALIADIRLKLGREPDLVLWQNGVAGGEVWAPETGRARHFKAGLPKGSSDLVGICRGRFIAIEVKTGRGKARPGQLEFQECVRKHGGFACIVHSVDEARAALARARLGESQ